MGLSRAITLSNCFINIYTIKCKYSDELVKEIEKNCPTMFKNELRIPDFYLNIIKGKVDNQ